ncbi:MAG: CPBP family intramembrane metalloprotease [Acidobacteriia bacterium]|nr:CPBP family intramembrane metalloprotease [Terriglobia bacterium]
MQLWVIALLLAAVLGFFSRAVQTFVRSSFERRPALVLAVPFLLTGIFTGAARLAHAASWPLGVFVLAYTAAPVVCVYIAGVGVAKRPSAWDFVAVLLLWLPLEFAAGARFVPVPARGFLHSVAYGIAILLGLVLFLCFRSFPGLKYNPPQRAADLWLPLVGFAAVAPVLILLGIAIGFIPPPHWPNKSGTAMAAAAAVIFAGTALPEEILFRSLIQNLLMLRFGSGFRILLAASFIFGCAHLDNGPQPLPNWRYMILATVAGLAYGRVFVRASTVLSSTALHAMVDWTKHFFF